MEKRKIDEGIDDDLYHLDRLLWLMDSVRKDRLNEKLCEVLEGI